MGEVAPIALAPFTGGTSLLALGANTLKKALTPPKPPGAPGAPDPSTKAVQQVAIETSQRRSRARGYRSTILSQMMSDQSPALKDTFGA